MVNWEMIMSGSHVCFRERPHVSLTARDREQKEANIDIFKNTLLLLRKFRTRALAETDSVARQEVLRKAHYLASQLAEVIFAQALSDKPTPIKPAFMNAIKKLKEAHAGEEAESGHGLPSGFSIGNLLKAIDDMLVRLEEKAGSCKRPNHKLTAMELESVLTEFLHGTNLLSADEVRCFFDKDTRIGGILSGGSVYLELVKQFIERFGEPSLAIETFVIAVDKDTRRTAFETSEADATTKQVIITDDMIDKGGTMLTALWAAGECFPEALISCGKGVDQPGAFAERRLRELLTYTDSLFQDYADLSEDGQFTEALELFRQAEEHAATNNYTLPRGWYLRKARIEDSLKNNRKKLI